MCIFNWSGAGLPGLTWIDLAHLKRPSNEFVCCLVHQMMTMTVITHTNNWHLSVMRRRKGKCIYIALFLVPPTNGTQAWITQCYLQLHQCLPLPRKRSPDGASPHWDCGHLIAAYYSFIYPEKMSWLTYSGRFTHISGHPSAAGRAQDTVRSESKKRCNKGVHMCWKLYTAVVNCYRQANATTNSWTN